MFKKLLGIFRRRQLSPEELAARADGKRVLEDETTLRASQGIFGSPSWVDPKSGRDRR
jgi:2-hydroxychromene-2-carboxylate isomerase